MAAFRLMLCCVFLLVTFAQNSQKSCVEVPKAKCGDPTSDNCLKCGTSSDFDCEECCPGCKQITTGAYKYCDCKDTPTPAPGPGPASGDYLCYDGTCYSKPGSGTMSKEQCENTCKAPAPGPAPTPSTGSWANYKVAGMDVLSVTGTGKVEKVIIMLHGGGGEGTDWKINYDQGWFGDTSGLKYVFPSSPSKLWYGSTKQAGCGLCDECAYVAGTIEASATRIASLIQHEMPVVGNVTSKVYLAGFSQGAQLTAYMQIAKLDFPLGGTVVMDGYALPPVCSSSQVKSKATYSGSDMKWFLYWGGADGIFPAAESLKAYHDMLGALNASSTLKYEHTEPGMGHTLIEKEFVEMVKFIRA